MCELRLSLPPTSAAQMGANQQACKWGAARHMASHLQVSTCMHTNTGPSWLHTQAHTNNLGSMCGCTKPCGLVHSWNPGRNYAGRHTTSSTSTRTTVPPYCVEIRLLGPWKTGSETACPGHLCAVVGPAPSRQLHVLRITCLGGPCGHRSLQLLNWLIPPSVQMDRPRSRKWGNVSLLKVTQL